MVTLRHDGPYNTAVTLHFLLPFMLKSDLMKAAKKLDLYISPSYTKDKMGAALAAFILSNPKEVLEVFNGKELTLMKELIAAGANTCVARPMQKRFNNLQNLGLVVTHEDEPGKQWKMMMPDEVRTCFALHIDGKIASKTASLKPRELTLRISLDDLPIYRTLRVLDTISLQELYCVITFLFDWCDMRSHAFRLMRSGNWLPMTSCTRLSELLLQPGEQMGFVYDFSPGDNWQHTIEVLAVNEFSQKVTDYMPCCVEVGGGDPGEKSGGNQEVKKFWNEFSKAEPPSLYLLNDTIQFFWKNKG